MADGSEHLQKDSHRPLAPPAGAIHLPDIPLPRDMPAEPIPIADMAEIFGITHRTLHFYEEKGLISAQRIGLMRVYGHSDIARMALINACREIGMPVAGIQDLLEALRSANSTAEANRIFEDALLARKRELTADLSTIHRQLQQLASLVSHGVIDGPVDRAALPDDTIALTELERRCVELMAEDYTPARVAHALSLTSSQVETLETAIIRKLDAHNRFQAVAKAVLLGLVAS
ncbi:MULTISPECIES: MerR family transcriptional regulator [Alphaproteobacteria]|uniref:Transcriptional regulator n=2 Tax=Alphaproteobacteria TaxID=28211 RepID=A0A512HMV9_9HYPH|nr:MULTISPECIES: MerR family transcriptional regulator [Alphaproteobacteria]GEO86769.1 transcriptional regulator [Ciceribacter naphthalenivorans]GLR23348.1 transcriptional regulator [Ciceribacter naphthalenivorans]GLT06204.1 transcriptional regulator [Sphingomonas psychrolutea]